MGLALYRRLGFREVGRFRVQLEGERDFLEIPALVRPVGMVGGMREVEGMGVGVGAAGLGSCGMRVRDGVGGPGSRSGAVSGSAVAVGGWGEGAVCA